MKYLFGLILATAVAISSHAQVSPVSVVLTVGQWVLKDTKKVYYVRVQGSGQTNQEARNNAFRKAVELAVGSVILGETVVKNNEIIRNDIISYSSGYVDDFKIVSESDRSVTMDVWVSDSKIANRLETMGVSTGGTIDGRAIVRDLNRRTAQVQTENERHAGAMRMTNAVLADYPSSAYKIDIKKTYLEVKNGRSALIIQAKIDFTSKYADSIAEVLERTRHGRISNVNNMIQIERPWLNFTTGYWTNNTRDVWIKAFHTPTSMELNFGDYSACWDMIPFLDGQFFGTIPGSTTYVINTRKSINVTLALVNEPKMKMNESEFVNWISGMNKVEGKMVDSNTCNK